MKHIYKATVVFKYRMSPDRTAHFRVLADGMDAALSITNKLLEKKDPLATKVVVCIKQEVKVDGSMEEVLA